MTPILQQHAKRILACGYKSSLFRSYATLWSPEASQTLLIRVKASLQQHEKQLYTRGLIRIFEIRIDFLKNANYAARLYLIETLLGLEEADKFFKSIPSNMIDYSTLLTSYARSDDVKPDNVTANTVLKADVKAIKMFMRMWVDEEGIKLERDRIVEMAKVYVRVCLEIYGNVVWNARELLQTLWDDFKKCEEVYRTAVISLSKLDDVEGAEDIYGEGEKKEQNVREQVTKKAMMLLHVLNLLLILITLSLPFFVCPPNLSIPLVVLSVILTHISITRLLRFVFF
ncbi:T7A14.13 [Arabidopsis thaliana]|uniref:T7A14.13 n=1 Tax=Arabidopsis thaliana TaxID=3702 RepID=Q9ZVN5_ARATH|nr:T7A14.13 [Arabidopsis thaliana]